MPPKLKPESSPQPPRPADCQSLASMSLPQLLYHVLTADRAFTPEHFSARAA